MNKESHQYNLRGLFPLPEEPEEYYLTRCMAIKKGEDHCPAIVEALYCCKPDWVRIEYSDDNLLLWEAGATFYDEEKGLSHIQLRRAFLQKESYLGLYSRLEVLAHEYIHAIRFPLQSEKYEEFFAYFIAASFGSKFRAFWGPLFTKPIDAVLFFIASLIPFGALFTDSVDPFFFLIPLLTLFTFFSLRLCFRWRRWRSCKEKVGLPLMIRLTDQEIDLFSQLKTAEIEAFIETESALQFRWKLLESFYK